MKIKLLFSFLLFFVIPGVIYPQKNSGKKEVQRKQAEKVVAKPPAYDSTKTLEEQYRSDNQYQFIGLQLVLPPVIDAEAGPILFSNKESALEKGNKKYAIIDILKGDLKEQLKQKKAVNLCGYRYKDLNSVLWKEMIVHVVFVLRENNGGSDSLKNGLVYWVVCESKQAPYSNSNFNSFISAPYFEKQKQIFQDQTVVKLDDKSKWLCKEVTVLKSKDANATDTTYDVFCILTNEKGDQLKLRPPSDKYGRSFITEKEYNWLDHANRNEKEQLLREENEKREKHLVECISKFGQHKGELIAQNKIEIGMTIDMCKAAWGAPWNISQAITSPVEKETWFYNWKYELYFENKILVKIKH